MLRKPTSKNLMPVGDQWLLKVFWADTHLTVTLRQTEHADPEGELVLEVSELHFEPRSDPAAWLNSIDLDALVDEANQKARQLVGKPEFQAVRWTHGTRRGRSTPDSLLEEVVKLRKTLSVSEITGHLDRSRSQIFRYLQLARERDITGQGGDDGPS